MQTPNIRNISVSPVNYFLQSSWKGKAIQVLCAVSFCTLIIFMAFLRKTFNRGSPPASLVGRARQRNTELQEPQTEDLSYIKAYPANQDFFRVSEFGRWISEKMKDYEPLPDMAKDTSKQASFWLIMNRFHKDIVEQATTMKPDFEKLPNFKDADWVAFRVECGTILTNVERSCATLKACLDKLQAWNQALLKEMKDAQQQNNDGVNTYPHYEFTNLQTQYFPYLGLHTKDDFTKHLSTEMSVLATVGLVEMEDIYALELTAMMPSIEELRHLFCSLEITKDEKTLCPLIKPEIEKCREVLTRSEDLLDHLQNQNKEELKQNVKQMRTLFRNFSSDYTNALTQLKEIEKQDIARQLILLKGYLNQQHLRGTFIANEETRLSQYAKKIDNLSLLYQIGQ